MKLVQPVRKTYVEFYLHEGGFCDAVIGHEVSSRNMREISLQEGVYALRFFDIIEAQTEDGILLVSDRQNASPSYFIGGRVLTLDQLMNEMPTVAINSLLASLEHFGYEKVILINQNLITGFADEDMVLDRSQFKS